MMRCLFRGNPQGRVAKVRFLVLRPEPSPCLLTGGASAKKLSLASFFNAAAQTVVCDQGLCPWTLVAFEKAPQNFMRPAALVFASVCAHEQNRCFPMTVNSGLDQIQALVAVTGLK